jgi:hypothetical protein
MSASPGSPLSIAISSKKGKKGKVIPLNPTDVIPVYLDVETAKTLLTALALALSNPINKKKKKSKKGGKGPKGGPKGGLKSGKVA